MSLESRNSILSSLKPKSTKLAVVLGLILGGTATAVGQVGCGIDAYGTLEGTGPEPDSGNGGAGGEGGNDAAVNPDAIFPLEDAGMDSGNFPDAKPDVDAMADADVGKDADVGMDATVDADADVSVDASVDASPDAEADAGMDAAPDADAGVDASVDAGSDADVDAGCIDLQVTFNNMAEHALRVFRGGCNEGDVIYSNYSSGAGTFVMSDTTVCIKNSDKVIVQVKDGLDKNSVEFTSSNVPSKALVRDIGATAPMTYSASRAYCLSTSGWDTLDVVASDKNPLPMSYKFEGNIPAGGLPPSNVFQIVY